MFENTTRLFTENLARAMDRRRFLRRASETAFAGMAALAAGHMVPALAAAGSGKTGVVPEVPRCSPPGPYCNINGLNEPNGCQGGSCFQHLNAGQILQCKVYYQYYPGGCWTTASSGGYWTCCDCECGNPRRAACGCAKWSGTQTPRPDSPEGMPA